MTFDWMIQGEKIREQNNNKVSDYASLLEQEKEKVEAEEAAEEARAAAEAAALGTTEGTDEETTTNELGGNDNDTVAGVAEALAAVENGETEETGYQITNEDIDKLSELHPNNGEIGGLQDSLRALLEDGKNMGDLDPALQDQLKELLGFNNDKAMQGNSVSEDQDTLNSINDQINNGADAAELFEQELLKEAQEIYGEAELVSEETADDGTITKKFKAADGTEFQLVESSKDGLSSVALNLDDGSSISMVNREGHPSGLGMMRHSVADEETGVMDFTFVNLDVSQEGTSRYTTDESGEAVTVNNYTQTEADGSVKENVTSEFFADGTSTTRFQDENGVGHLSISNKDFTVTEAYTSEDGYQTATKTELSVDENGEAQWNTSVEAPDMVGPSPINVDEATAARRNKTLETARNGSFEQNDYDKLTNKINNLASGDGISDAEGKLLEQDAIAATSNLADKANNGELTLTLDEFLAGDPNNPVVMQQTAQYMAELETAIAEDLTNQLNEANADQAQTLQGQIDTANNIGNAYRTMDEGLDSVVDGLQIDFGGIDESAAQTMLQEQVALKQDLQSQLNQFQGQDTDLARASAADVTVQLAMVDKVISELARQFP